jgi:pimeloyl-ACP methyl ester carboxylesterase
MVTHRTLEIDGLRIFVREVRRSDAPPVERFAYTFDNLTAVTRKVLDRLGVASYVLYLHDYGLPIGLRLATAVPERVRGLVIQNANA